MSVELFTNYPVRSDCAMFPSAMAHASRKFGGMYATMSENELSDSVFAGLLF